VPGKLRLQQIEFAADVLAELLIDESSFSHREVIPRGIN
jgi:hypothetical protein